MSEDLRVLCDFSHNFTFNCHDLRLKVSFKTIFCFELVFLSICGDKKCRTLLLILLSGAILALPNHKHSTSMFI